MSQLFAFRILVDRFFFSIHVDEYKKSIYIYVRCQIQFLLKSYCSESQPWFVPAGHIQHIILS